MTSSDAGHGGIPLPESPYSQDNGEADPSLVSALATVEAHSGSVKEIVHALEKARVLVPIVATGEERHVGAHGYEQDAVAATGVVAVRMPDGRAALPVFTDVEAMRAWNAEARPIPVEGRRAALAAVAEEWGVLVINPAAEAVIIPRPAVWALAQGRVWLPAVEDGVVDHDIVGDVTNVVSGISSVQEVVVEPGQQAEVAIVVTLEPRLTQEQLREVSEKIQHAVSRLEIVAQRVDSIQVMLSA